MRRFLCCDCRGRGLCWQAARLAQTTSARRWRCRQVSARRRRCREPQAASLADLKWFEVFHDEELQELIRVALKQNYDLRDAVARVDEARANLGITRSNQIPQVGASRRAGDNAAVARRPVSAACVVCRRTRTATGDQAGAESAVVRGGHLGTPPPRHRSRARQSARTPKRTAKRWSARW